MGVLTSTDKLSGSRIRFYETLRFLMFTNRGSYQVNEKLRCLALFIGEIRRLHPTKALIDMTDGEFVVDMKTVMLRNQVFTELGMPKALPTAFVVREMDAGCLFYQAAMREMGWDMRVFENREEAFAWLRLPPYDKAPVPELGKDQRPGSDRATPPRPPETVSSYPQAGQASQRPAQ